MKSDKKARSADSDSDSEEESIQEIPGMELDNKYTSKKSVMPENSSEIQKELEKAKKDLEKIKLFIVKKYPFTQAIGILSPQSIKFFIEEELGEGVPKEQAE